MTRFGDGRRESFSCLELLSHFSPRFNQNCRVYVMPVTSWFTDGLLGALVRVKLFLIAIATFIRGGCLQFSADFTDLAARNNSTSREQSASAIALLL